MATKKVVKKVSARSNLVKDFIAEFKEIHGEAKDKKLRQKVFSLLNQKQKVEEEIAALDLQREVLEEKQEKIEEEIAKLA